MSHELPPEPCHSFFAEIDRLLEKSVDLHCLGGFVITTCFGLARPTVDVDCHAIIPTDEVTYLQRIAGEGSSLHRKHGVYLQRVGIVTLPEDYLDRTTEMFASTYTRLRLFRVEAHDLALSKLERNSARDREDVRHLHRIGALEPTTLEKRYRDELRPNLANVDRHDLTMRLWLELLQADK